MAKAYLVTGGAGFIGSHLVDSLLEQRETQIVRVIDNFGSGREEHLAQHSDDSRLEVVRRDLLDLERIQSFFAGTEVVYHLAANPDARWGIENTRLDLEQETIVTYNVLESMRRSGCRCILLSSSGTVYGDIGTTPAAESWGPCLPISLYGAGKVASEALISAFCGTFGLTGMILRFGNVIGPRTTHGLVFDLIQKLAADETPVSVLGDGRQAKPYVYVLDLVRAMRFLERVLQGMPAGAIDVFNVAPEGATSVRFIVEALLSELGLLATANVCYGTSPQGWPGDAPQSRMNTAKLRRAGFCLPRSSDEAVRTALRAIVEWLQQRPEGNHALRLPRRVR